MGSVSMQSQASSRGERLSAFVDGELFGEEHLNLDKFISGLDGEDRAAWSAYHLIGDALRSDDLAIRPAASSAFMSGFAARFDSEPHVLAPAAMPVARPSAGVAPPRRAGFRCCCCRCYADVDRRAATARRAGRPGAQVASIQSHGDSLQRVAMAPVPAANVQPVAQDANIIRDASLDQYLEAHQQFAQQPVMPGSMPLIRAAAVSTQGQ